MQFRSVLKANPYHDARGRFASAQAHASSSGWAEYGSPGKRDRLLNDPAYRQALYEKEMGDLKEGGLRFLGEHGGTDAKIGTDMSTASAKQLGAAWDNMVGAKVTPKEFVSAMVGKNHMDAENLKSHGITFEHNSQSKIIRFEGDGGIVHGAQSRGINREFNLKTKQVHHEYLELLKTEQGGGAVKKAMAAGLPMYKQMGMKSVTLSASLSMGGYAWAKYGFKLENAQDAGHYIAGLRGSMRHYAEKLTSPAAKKEVTTALSAMTAFQMKHFESLSKSKDGIRDAPHFMAGMKLKAATDEFRANYHATTGKTTRHTFMSQVMSSNGFGGVLNLKSKQDMARINRYIGGRHPKT